VSDTWGGFEEDTPAATPDTPEATKNMSLAGLSKEDKAAEMARRREERKQVRFYGLGIYNGGLMRVYRKSHNSRLRNKAELEKWKQSIRICQSVQTTLDYLVIIYPLNSPTLSEARIKSIQIQGSEVELASELLTSIRTSLGTVSTSASSILAASVSCPRVCPDDAGEALVKSLN
jgi:hypothetical protein